MSHETEILTAVSILARIVAGLAFDSNSRGLALEVAIDIDALREEVDRQDRTIDIHTPPASAEITDANVALARAAGDGAAAERARIVAALWADSENGHGMGGAIMIRHCAWLVRCDFSEDAVLELQGRQDDPLS